MADSIDVLMRIVGRSGPFAGQSETVFAMDAVNDSLQRDFEPGRFSELQSFTYAVGVTFADKKATGKTDPKTDPKTGAKTGAKAPAKPAAAAATTSQTDFVDIQPVEFTRILDSSSTLLFKALTSCETLETVSIVKRKAGGATDSGICYLRFDFSKVLMIDLSWKDGVHVMVETGKFIYRKATVRYRPQKSDGSLGPVIQFQWTMP